MQQLFRLSTPISCIVLGVCRVLFSLVCLGLSLSLWFS